MKTDDIKFSEISDQQYADLIAYFVRKKGVDKIVIHDEGLDITITRQVRSNDKDIIDTSVAAYAALIAAPLI